MEPFARKTITGLVAAVALVATACSAPDENADPSTTPVARTETPSTVAAAASQSCSIDGLDVGASTDRQPGSDDIGTNPEAGTGYREGMEATAHDNFAVVTANPLATQAACEVLADGGTAADALVTAQLVLGLVEPQSSGIGGGGYILYADAESGDRVAIDGREVAPLAADGEYLQNAQPDARSSGRSIGVPGIVAALDELHGSYGKKDWAELFDAPTALAEDGFEISPRLAALIDEHATDLARDENAGAYFLDDGTPRQAGDTLTNPEYAETLDMLATDGAESFYTGDFAAEVVDAATAGTAGRTPSLLTTADFAGYSPIVREQLCGDYRDRTICSMPPSSSGGLAVLSVLGMLDNHESLSDLAGGDPGVPSPEAVHLISEAERLAYADRDAYVADPEFVDVPVDELLDSEYLQKRFELIDPAESMGTAEPGLEKVAAEAVPERGTTHVSIIDSYGNAASMTSSVEAAFGSFHMVNGFLLNNQLTDFSADPVNEDGEDVANRVEAAKRPRSSMAPVLVFDEANNVEMSLGSPGGSLIIQYVIKTLVQLIDFGADPQEAVAAVNFGALNDEETAVGGEHPADLDDLTSRLEEMGHDITDEPMTSGLGALVIRDGQIHGGADPRREGVVLGE